MMLLGYDSFIFVPIAKNGSTTVKKTLLKKFGPQWDMTPAMAAENPRPKIIMWRDPYKRMESTWRFFKKKGDTDKDFNEFVLDPPENDVHLRTQVSFIEGIGDHREIFYWDWQGLGKRLGVDFPRMNATPEEKTVWMGDAALAVAETYLDDLEVWIGGR